MAGNPVATVARKAVNATTLVAEATAGLLMAPTMVSTSLMYGVMPTK